MSTITTLNSTDSGATSRGVINTNFSNLNTDKLEAADIVSKAAGAASSTDNAVARFDGTGGKTLQNSGLVVNDVVGTNAILSLANLASTNKTFTFPNKSMTFAGTAGETFTGTVTFDVNGDGGTGNGVLLIDNNGGVCRIEVYVPGTFAAKQLDIQALKLRFSPLGGTITASGSINYAADAQANDTYVITLDPAPSDYYTGQQIIFKANTANTGAATLNVNSLGAKTIVKGVNTTLADNDILAGMFCLCIYDGTNFVLMNPRTL